MRASRPVWAITITAALSTCSDADIVVLAVILAVVKPSQNGSLEDALGGFKTDPMLSDVGLILGHVPFKRHLPIINIIYNYNRPASKIHPRAVSTLLGWKRETKRHVVLSPCGLFLRRMGE